MKKLNKKGITLIELIVSFAIVSVAMIYFYQTIVDLHRIYKNSSKSTEEFVNKSYALRVIHAYIDEKTITSLSTDINVCTQYLLSYCNTLSISDDGNYKKIELKDSSNNVLATTYYYAPSEIAKAVEEIMVDGNVGSYTSFENAIKKYVETETEDGKIQLKNHEIKIEIGSDNKIEYKLFETDKTEPIYSVKNSKSINEIIDSISDKNQTNIQNKVQELIGGDYSITEDISGDETKGYVLGYNIIDSDGSTVATNIYETKNLNVEKITSIKDTKGNEQINKEYEFNTSDSVVQKGNFVYMSTNYNDKYILKFKIDTNLVSSTDASSFNDKSIIALYNNYSDGDGVEIYFDKNEIKHRVTFSNFSGGSIDLQDTIRETTIKDDRYITFYGFKFNAAWYKTYSSQNTKFKIKLVEAYKYK